jgi:hypothetical protein
MSRFPHSVQRGPAKLPVHHGLLKSRYGGLFLDYKAWLLLRRIRRPKAATSNPGQKSSHDSSRARHVHSENASNAGKISKGTTQRKAGTRKRIFRDAQCSMLWHNRSNVRDGQASGPRIATRSARQRGISEGEETVSLTGSSRIHLSSTPYLIAQDFPSIEDGRDGACLDGYSRSLGRIVSSTRRRGSHIELAIGSSCPAPPLRTPPFYVFARVV